MHRQPPLADPGSTGCLSIERQSQPPGQRRRQSWHVHHSPAGGDSPPGLMGSAMTPDAALAELHGNHFSSGDGSVTIRGHCCPAWIGHIAVHRRL